MSLDAGEIPAPRLPGGRRSALAPASMQARALDAAAFLKALGHDGRLLILYHLRMGERNVADLERLCMSRQSAVSQQLARLRHERLVTTRREGNQIVYALADPRVRRVLDLLDRLHGGGADRDK